MPISRPTSSPAAYATNGGVRTEPDAGEKATGVIASQRIPAKIMNWLWGVALEWVAWFAAIIDANEEHTYQTAKTRTRFFTLRVDGTNGAWTSTQGAVTHGSSSTDHAWHFLDDELRTGDVLSFIHIKVDPATTAISSARAYKINGGTGTITYLGTLVSTDGTNAIQTLALNGLAETIDRTTYIYGIELTSGTNGASYGFSSISTQDHGPRNPS